MKIDRLAVHGYRWPRAQPISNGRFTYNDATTVVVTVSTDEGVTGTGFGPGLLLPGGERAVAAMVQVFEELLRGEDPLDHERLWARMWEPKLFGRRGFETRVLSMIDIALWDLKAKVAGMPLYKLLGGFRDSIPCYIAGGYYQEGKDLSALADEMRGHLELGVRAIKMKIGRLSIIEDVKRVEAVRSAIGPDVQLLTDANGAYSTAEACRMARAMEDLDVYWFEEPVLPDNYAGHAAVARASSIPVAAGENEYTRYGFRDLIATGMAGVLNPDAEILGGITEFNKVAAMAQAHDVAIAPHGRQEIHIHLVCAISNGLMVEYYRDNVDPLAARLMVNPPQLRQGLLHPTEEPGHGIILDEEAVAAYRTH